MPKIVSKYVQVHIAAFIDGKYKFLSLQRSSNLKVYPNIWQVITGTIEDNETALQTAIREVKEETNLSIDKMWAIPTIVSFYNYPDDEIHLSVAFGVLTNNFTDFRISYEHQDFVWEEIDKHIERLALFSHKETAKIFFNQILINKNNIIPEIDLSKLI